MLLGLLVNVTLLVILTTWFFWWRRAARHIETFKQARLEMGQLVTQLQSQLATAHEEIAKATVIAQEAVPELQAAIRRADGLVLELRGVAGVGERIAERIEDAARTARNVVAPATPTRSAAARARTIEPELDPAAELAVARARLKAPRKLFRGRPSDSNGQAGAAASPLDAELA